MSPNAQQWARYFWCYRNGAESRFDEEQTYRIVGDDEADFKQNRFL